MYEIKVLSSEEFDSVSKSDPRYEYVDDSNMGFADREKGVAYVRGSNIHDLNKYLIDHELEELESDSSTHEDPNGIRHKKFFKEFLPRFFFPALELFKPTTKVGEGIKNTLFPQSQPESPQTVTGGMEGLHMSPFNFFNPTPTENNPASPRISETVTGGIQGNILGNNQLSNFPPELLEKLRGNFSGRSVSF